MCFHFEKPGTHTASTEGLGDGLTKMQTAPSMLLILTSSQNKAATIAVLCRCVQFCAMHTEIIINI